MTNGNPSAVLVRDGTGDDLPRLTEIYNHYVVNTATTFDVEPFTVEQRREWFRRYGPTGRYRLLVAEERGNVLGYTTTSPFHPRLAYETTVEMTVLCAPDAIGRGIGQRMYETMFDAVAGEDIHLALAAITMPNDASVALHERFGFSRTALLPEVGRKFGRYWDVLWMTRPFAAPAALE
jgi:phosphinothricin acetyltransferase